MPTASQKFGFHNRVFNGLRETDNQQVEAVLEALDESSCWIGSSSGRCERALNTPFSELGRNSDEKKYENFNDIGFRGHTFDKAAPKYERDYQKSTAIFASSSGGTEETVEAFRQLASYLPSSNKWNVVVLTQKPNSKIGKMARENNAILVELKGSGNSDSKNYREFGMDRDVGEHQVLWFSQAICQTLLEGAGPERFYEIVDERLPEVCGKVDAWSESKTCKRIVRELRRHCDVFTAGRKGGKEAAKFFYKRIGQVKQLGDDQAYLFGENAPDPRIGDMVFPISNSGGRDDVYSKVLKGTKPAMVTCCEKARKARAIVYPFVATPDSPMEEVCGKRNTVLVDSATKGFSDAYPRIMTQQGIIPILLAEAYEKEEGIDISPRNLKKKHGW